METAPLMTQQYNREAPKTPADPMMTSSAHIMRVKPEKKKEEYSIAELARRTEEKITEIDAGIEIFMDGPTSGHQLNDGAGVFIQDRLGTILYEEAKAAGRICSSYD